jgi:hypothetical protein
MKAKIYHSDKPQSLEALREKITACCAQVIPEELAAGVGNIVQRLSDVIDFDGGHIEHLS